MSVSSFTVRWWQDNIWRMFCSLPVCERSERTGERTKEWVSECVVRSAAVSSLSLLCLWLYSTTSNSSSSPIWVHSCSSSSSSSAPSNNRALATLAEQVSHQSISDLLSTVMRRGHTPNRINQNDQGEEGDDDDDNNNETGENLQFRRQSLLWSNVLFCSLLFCSSLGWPVRAGREPGCASCSTSPPS